MQVSRVWLVYELEYAQEQKHSQHMSNVTCQIVTCIGPFLVHRSQCNACKSCIPAWHKMMIDISKQFISLPVIVVGSIAVSPAKETNSCLTFLTTSLLCFSISICLRVSQSVSLPVKLSMCVLRLVASTRFVLVHPYCSVPDACLSEP